MRAQATIGSLVLVLWLGHVAPVAAEDAREQARQRFAAGEARFRAGEYRAAIAEFQAADALVPSPILAFNIAVCREKLGEDEEAIRLYRDYLARRPDAPNRAQVEERILSLERLVAMREVAAGAAAEAAAPSPAPPSTPAAAPAVPEPTVSEAPAPTSMAVAREAGSAAGAPVPGPVAEQPAAHDQPVAVDPASGAAAPASPRAYDGPLSRRVPDRRGANAASPAPWLGTPEPLPAPAPEAPPASDQPVYKHWWFWVVVGVAAVVLVDIAAGGGESGAAAPPSVGAALRF